MDKREVDEWVKQNNEFDAYHLLDERLPGIRTKLDRLDKRIIELLEEVRSEFPDAEYYTAYGCFTLALGSFHEGGGMTQIHRSAWSGSARISDCDY
jgi:hypothetical protein